MEKPSKVEVGQRWHVDNWGVHGMTKGLTFEVVRFNGGRVYYRYDSNVDVMDRDVATFERAIASLTYLGGPEPVKPPAPAKGQRWRNNTNGEEMVIESVRERGEYPVQLRWLNTQKYGLMRGAWERDMRDFTFVDHGEPASPALPTEEGPQQVSATGPGSYKNPSTGRAADARAEKSAPTLTARAILQAKERARQEKREEDARAVAAFCNDFDLLPDAP